MCEDCINTVSSAYAYKVGKSLRRSLSMMLNNRGPSTEPCGTPWESVLCDDIVVLTLVIWDLSER